MLHKTRAIVFKTTDYGETSVIVQLFTEKFGLQSYIINGVKKPKGEDHPQYAAAAAFAGSGGVPQKQ